MTSDCIVVRVPYRTTHHTPLISFLGTASSLALNSHSNSRRLFLGTGFGVSPYDINLLVGYIYCGSCLNFEQRCLSLIQPDLTLIRQAHTRVYMQCSYTT